MREAVVAEGPLVTIHDVSMPQISSPRQLVIKVIVSGSNPKDWKGPVWYGRVFNQGDDIAGIVHAVGDDVTEFKVGDRVAAFHEMKTPGGSYAEYALSWEWSTFHLAKNTSFEAAATVPLAAMTAAISLYQTLKLPHPWTQSQEPLPLIIYGAASAVGAFAVKLAGLSNIHPLICVAGRGASFVETLIDRTKGDVIVDYRGGDEATVNEITSILKGGKLRHAFDAVSDGTSYINISKVIDPHEGKICLVLPDKDYKEIPETIEWEVSRVGRCHDDIGLKNGTHLLAQAFFRLFGAGLGEGWFKPHPYEVIPGGLAGLQTGLSNLKSGKASAVKYVFRISDTPGLEGASTVQPPEDATDS